MTTPPATPPAPTPVPPPAPKRDPRDRFIEDAIRRELDALRQANASVDPSTVARALDPEQWKKWMDPVRQVARALAERGVIEVTRHGKPVSEWPWRGVIRLRKPRSKASKPATEPPPEAPPETPPAGDDVTAPDA
jgi:hypothetical protein